MKISRYAHYFKSERFGYLLYCSRTNSFAEITESLFQKLKKIGEENIDPSEELSNEDLNLLKNSKVVINDAEDDNFIIEKKLTQSISNFNRRDLGLVICPTIDCNFDCVYCFETNKKPIFMSPDTENKIVHFIKRHEETKNVNITWYGGEPLLGFRSMKSLYEKINPNYALGILMDKSMG